MKFSVVPDSSERLTGVMRVSGSSTPGLSAAIALSFQLVISWLKIFARVSGVELQVFDAGEVVDDRDRRDVVRDLDQFARCAALFGLFEFAFFGREGGVAAGVGDAAGDELFATAAGPDRVVGDRHAGVFVLEFGDPGFLRGLLRGRAGAGDFAGDARRRRCRRCGSSLAAAAGGDAEREDAAEASTASHLRAGQLFLLRGRFDTAGAQPLAAVRRRSLLRGCVEDVKKM